MKHLLAYGLLCLLAALTLAGCKKESDAFTGLIGSWKLTKQECYCPSSPVPNRTVTFTATGYKFYQDGQLSDSGTYSDANIIPCGTNTLIQVLRLKSDHKASQDYISTIAGSLLQLDSGLNNKCIADAGIKYTYERL
ncbi:hypothetical protein I2I05_04680 [Hymenobacter sp. BT683]|uniref:Lipocalin-like domain-containing protein n=1 Tax=Hymenobacter jeongseonensis TaxID=2791027 RepID=A0ABS0IEB7_9BACT|nr:hypothetical protein [Hymenobacter jeongseonensis]MBF9236683.1 hypothetical protein [Hymenobacter jeongseonensis]